MLQNGPTEPLNGIDSLWSKHEKLCESSNILPERENVVQYLLY